MSKHDREPGGLVRSPRGGGFVALSVLALALLLGCGGAPRPTSPPTPTHTPAEVPAELAITLVTPQRDWTDAVLYFVVLDRYADGDPGNNAGVDRSAKGAFHGGDLKGLIGRLDDIADLGATAIWITPVVKNIPGPVTGAGFPDWGYHGYWADDFLSLDPRFGTEADLKNLVSEAHRRGIRVLLDVVYNHAGYESRYLGDPKTKDWFRREDRGTCGSDDLTSCVAGLPDFKTELPEVADYLLHAQIEWAAKTGLDGFRLDTVKHVDHPFWQEHRKRTRERLGKSFFLIGEVWGGDAQSLDPWFAGDEMDAGFDFSFQGSTVGFLEGRGRTAAFDHYLKSREKVRSGYLLSPYLSSHDVPGALSLLGGDVPKFRLAALLELTVSGLPMIYYGEEVARPGGDWPENRSDMPWGGSDVLPGKGLSRDEALRADYKKLIAIRRAHPALSRGTYESVSSAGDLLVFLRRDAASRDVVVVAVNRGAAPAMAKLDAPPEWAGKAVADALSGEPAVSVAGSIEIAAPPVGARILTLLPPGG